MALFPLGEKEGVFGLYEQKNAGTALGCSGADDCCPRMHPHRCGLATPRPAARGDGGSSRAHTTADFHGDSGLYRDTHCDGDADYDPDTDGNAGTHGHTHPDRHTDATAYRYAKAATKTAHGHARAAHRHPRA